ncbi:MAG: galactitol-1-phosphate 5-dehydrogenase [Candidatus Zipacnadales bacterium]
MRIPTEMIAAVLHAPGDLRIERVPVPQPQEGEVLIRVGACGICGSDVPRVMTKGTYRFPLIPGHEFAGTIAALGWGVEEWAEGERVAVFPLIPCRQCEWCSGKPGLETWHLCDNYDYLGSRSNGAFAEYVVAPAWNLVRVPDTVSIECAAMTEPAAVAYHALHRPLTDPPDCITIFGAGPIGIILAQWVGLEFDSHWMTDNNRPFPRLWLCDIREDKLEVARSITVADDVNASEVNPVEHILSATNGRGVDYAYEAAGVAVTLRQCIAVTAKLGSVVLMGNQAEDVTLPVDLFSQILRKELRLSGTWNSRFGPDEHDDWSTALREMASGRLTLGPLITHRYRIDQANAAFAMMSEGRVFHNKVLFCFD